MKIAEWLHALYPPENNQYWGSFQPDRVAEYLATATIDSATLDNLLKRASGEQEKRIITVLTRATLAHEKSRRSDMSKRGQRDLTAALNGPRRLHMETHLAVTKELSSPTEDVRGASDIAVRLLESGLKAFTDDGNQSYLIDPAAALGSYANRLFLLSYWLDVAGQPEKALTEGRRALEKYRVLTEENDSPRRFLLGVVLNRVGRLAVKAGEMGEALSLNLEALAIFRSLPGEDSSVLGLSVATSLREVGLHLSQSRRHDEGLNAGSEALATFSELEQENPNHSRDVMRSLAALSLMWYARGGLRRALKFAGESTQEYYKVPPSERASLNEYMSTVLGMKVMMLDEVGCTKEAEETRSEIAEIADFD
ncbi:tetratricopeptide repeat protein [Streptomyces sp. ODS28]|uniref:tetratricopeptide repeat protein n=1 Tax=Streptomyces sp. ODS28 TaxID=3136688 RepID=UPI0031E9978D